MVSTAHSDDELTNIYFRYRKKAIHTRESVSTALYILDRSEAMLARE